MKSKMILEKSKGSIGDYCIINENVMRGYSIFIGSNYKICNKPLKIKDYFYHEGRPYTGFVYILENCDYSPVEWGLKFLKIL
jgi:hypothetical protein